MQLKPITAIIVLFLVVASLLVAGCTNSTTNQTSSASPTGTASEKPANVADRMTQEAITSGYNVSKPFVQTTVNGYTAYAGVIDDGPKKLEPYRNNITIWLVPDRATAMKEFNASVAQARTAGYEVWSRGATSWSGVFGQDQPRYPLSQAQIAANAPDTSVNIYRTDLNLDVGNYSAFTVYTDYQTAIA